MIFSTITAHSLPAFSDICLTGNESALDTICAQIFSSLFHRSSLSRT